MKKRKTNYCTAYIEGHWSECCYTHDIESVMAEEYESAEMRLQTDIKLRDCVKAKGHPVHAQIMFFGIRAWYWTKWRWVDGITFKQGDTK